MAIDYNRDELIKMQEDAMRRVREMQNRARKVVDESNQHKSSNQHKTDSYETPPRPNEPPQPTQAQQRNPSRRNTSPGYEREARPEALRHEQKNPYMQDASRQERKPNPAPESFRHDRKNAPAPETFRREREPPPEPPHNAGGSPPHLPENPVNKKQNGFNGLNIAGIKITSDHALIISLLFLLYTEDADKLLILALLYIMF